MFRRLSHRYCLFPRFKITMHYNFTCELPGISFNIKNVSFLSKGVSLAPSNEVIVFVQNLVCAKNLQIDKSIHNAYVKAIRSAQHYIYIENQYFIGSSYYWSSNRSAGNKLTISHAIVFFSYCYVHCLPYKTNFIFASQYLVH